MLWSSDSVLCTDVTYVCYKLYVYIVSLIVFHFQATSENTRECESLAVKMKNQSTEIKDPSSKILSYRLPIKQTMLNKDKGIAKYVLGQPMPGQAVSEKVLMVVGATGAGKTTLINGMINYVFGVEWKDDFRLMLVTENTAKSQAHSQTDLITAYTIYPTHGSKFHYALTIIDTPGFGDTRGLERDKRIIQQIQDFFSIKDGNGIDHLDGIGFVAQASLARLTPIQSYVFHSILSVFGNDVANNLFIMVTFADGQAPPIMAAIKEAKIECNKHYKFNNSALFASNKESTNDDEEDFDRMFWKMGFISFKKFFDEFTKAQEVSLTLTKEVLQERQQLEITVQGLQQQISAGVAKLEELRQEEIILQQREAEIASNKDFTYSVTITKQKKVDLPTGQYVTNCLTCNFTCHKRCAFNNNEDKYRCSAMDGKGITEASCRICPQKCFWQNHVNNPYCFEIYTEEEVKTSDELKQKYQTAMQGKNKVEDMVNQINCYLLSVEDDVITKVSEVQRALQRLDKIALKQSPLTQVEHLDLLIQAEKQEGKPGWQSRIKIYQKAKEDAKILEKAKNNPEQLRILKDNRKAKIEQAKKKTNVQDKSWFSRLKYW